MTTNNLAIESLERQIKGTEEKLRQLRNDLAVAKSKEFTTKENLHDSPSERPLSGEEYQRYGRQLIVPSFGIHAQLRLKASSVLIVGAGGLGCPAAAYIAGSGVGTLGLVDGDDVEISNLHRQILHDSNKVGSLKVDSAVESLRRLNPLVQYRAHREHLSSTNAASIVADYDIVLDCTDHPTSRYLISDICVLLSKPLVSASALRTDGQLMILNNPPEPPGDVSGGPCYRCIFPKPPPADTVVSCGDGGILGPVVGVMGVLQALEAIKLIAAGLQGIDSSSKNIKTQPSLLLFSSNSSPPFRTVKLRPRRQQCFACSDTASLSLESLSSGSLDYAFFCGLTAPVDLLSPDERISAKEYARVREQDMDRHILLDVREKVQFDICNINGSVHVPFSSLQADIKHASKTRDQSKGQSEELKHMPVWFSTALTDDSSIYVICRMGNDSQVVTKFLKDKGLDKLESGGIRTIKDITGGLIAWKQEVDPTWPDY